MNFVLPSKNSVGYLDPEIAGEGQAVVETTGDELGWTPAPTKPIIPDLSEVKSLKKYFGRNGYAAWPSWIYHPVHAPKLVMNAKEAREYGLIYRETTPDEKARYGKNHQFDWIGETEWRPVPFPKDIAFDPNKAAMGKEVTKAEKSASAMHNEMLAAMLNQQKQGTPVFDKASLLALLSDPEVRAALLAEVGGPAPDKFPTNDAGNALAATPADDERALWIAEAERREIKIDKRWSTERIKEAIEGP